jgi:hypothetical protein
MIAEETPQKQFALACPHTCTGGGKPEEPALSLFEPKAEICRACIR